MIMCRMVMAIGTFDPGDVLAGARAMAAGARAPADAPVRRHPNGWGVAHRAFGGGLTQIKGEGSLDEIGSLALPLEEPGVLVVHARHATRPHMTGLQFAHPLVSEDTLFCHNGYTPGAAAWLGLDRDAFDTAALFKLLVPDPGRIPDEPRIRRSLSRLGADDTSANAFIIGPERAVVVNWFSRNADYFTLWRLTDRRGTVCASEILPELAPPDEWRPLGHGQILDLSFKEILNG